jgi:hypothetical protein
MRTPCKIALRIAAGILFVAYVYVMFAWSTS